MLSLRRAFEVYGEDLLFLLLEKVGRCRATSDNLLNQTTIKINWPIAESHRLSGSSILYLFFDMAGISDRNQLFELALGITINFKTLGGGPTASNFFAAAQKSHQKTPQTEHAV